MRDIDLFAGPGGWETGARPLGLSPVGIELDRLACATAEAAGHIRVRADVAALNPRDFGPVRGLIGSPPCPGFSDAGARTGLGDRDLLMAAAALGATPAVLAGVREQQASELSALVLEPLRWAETLRPEWIALEQVPHVLPVWEALAARLAFLGYSAVTGVLRAEQYGVPQVRKRAVLIASRVREVTLPEPTHSRYHPTAPARLDAGVKPWVPMAEAVGWGYTHRPSGTLVSRSGGGPRLLDGGSGAWEGVQRAVAAGQWVRRLDRLHLPFNRGEVSTCPISDGGVLQTFPADYPWQGTTTMQSKQVGNAVPPALAEVVLAAASGLPNPPSVCA